MGRLPRRRGAIDWVKTRRLARQALDELGVHVDARQRIEDLPLELQQEVEVARAVSANSKVLILDEATSALSEAATERLIERIHQLRDRGVAIVFISHRLREVYSCASRATVLRDGRLIGTVPLPETGESRLVQMMVGREIDDLFNKRRIEQRRARARRAEADHRGRLGARRDLSGAERRDPRHRRPRRLRQERARARTRRRRAFDGRRARARAQRPAALARVGDGGGDQPRARRPEAERDPADSLGSAQPVGGLDDRALAVRRRQPAARAQARGRRGRALRGQDGVARRRRSSTCRAATSRRSSSRAGSRSPRT